MSTKFAAWLRVTPAPTTLAESSAILKHLRTQGRVNTFIRSSGNKTRDGVVSFYTVFSHEPPSLPTKFEVPVYHNSLNPRDEDPFNIRGLQNRKPLPAPKTFACTFEIAQQDGLQEKTIESSNVYHKHFAVKKDDWLQEVYGEIGVPPGVKQGLGIVDKEKPLTVEEQLTKGATGGRRKIPLNTLMETWYEAIGAEKPQTSVNPRRKAEGQTMQSTRHNREPMVDASVTRKAEASSHDPFYDDDSRPR